jgi:hypothetical protein
MFIPKHIQKIAVALVLVLFVQVSIASISSGIADERAKNSKYSLKNLGLRNKKFVPISSLKSDLLFSGSQILNFKKNGGELNSLMEFDRGNTTYVFPYKFKVRVPKFKTPSPVNQ